ncbi:unnamed protein product [Rhizoctonia solani]|uniref:Uncharacterized protein n=1 Tax=Rhizoctonia solani TaxID=456999 RepID=A0A8H3DHD3_9AGAM|nr:unnamed protein product [Rhizoctonia solani]
MSAILEHFKPPPLASDPPAKTKFWPAPPKGSSGGILQRPKTESVISSNGSQCPSSPASRVSFAPLPELATRKRSNSITLGIAARSAALRAQRMGPHPPGPNRHPGPAPGRPRRRAADHYKDDQVIDLGEVAIDAGKKLWHAISRKASMASDSGRPDLHTVSHRPHGEMGGPTVGATGHNTEREISVRGFAVPEDDEEDEDEDEDDEEVQHRTEDYVAGVQAMHISANGGEGESIEPGHIRPTRLSPPPLSRSETDSSAGASGASTPNQGQEREPPADTGKDTPGRQNAQSMGVYDEWICIRATAYGRAPKPNLKCCRAPAPDSSTKTVLSTTEMAPPTPTHKHISYPYALYISIALLQAAELWEPLDMKPGRIWYLELCRWAGEKEMAYVCWTTYIAVCVAMVMNTLTRGLEGVASDGPHSFNLFGYSFLLHIYASPIMHQSPKHPEAHTSTPSRPDKHVLITIILPLLQLTILHVLAINKRLSRQRLIPTTACGLLSIIHFTYVTLFSHSTYPFFTYLNSLLEAFLVGIVRSSTAQHLPPLSVRKGRFVWNPFAEEDGVAHQSLLPNRSDDYAVALLKLGSACIEVTAMAGFGNEVSPIHTPDTIYISHSGSVIPKCPNAPPGLAREIKSVHAVEQDHSSTHAWFDIAWTREVGRFGERVARVAKGVWAVMTRRERAREDERPRGNKGEGEVYDIREVYARYLLGETVMSDDEDDEFRPGADVDESESDLDAFSEDGDGEEEEEEEDESAPALYADLARRSLPPQSYSRESSPSVPALTPMLIAHLTSPSRTPLTRNRYTALSYPPTLAIPPQQKPATNDEDSRAVCLALCDEYRASMDIAVGV